MDTIRPPHLSWIWGPSSASGDANVCRMSWPVCFDASSGDSDSRVIDCKFSLF